MQIPLLNIGMLVALKPIRAVGIERINVATYQAVSGTGKAAIEELAGQTARLLNGSRLNLMSTPDKSLLTPCRTLISFRTMVTPGRNENGVGNAENFGRPHLGKPYLCSGARVFGHAEAVHIETRAHLRGRCQRAPRAADGVTVIDRREAGGYPTPVTILRGGIRCLWAVFEQIFHIQEV